jgi:hypothetical protein
MATTTVRLSESSRWALKIASARLDMTPAAFFDLLTAKDKRAERAWKDAVDYVRKESKQL